MSSPVSTSLPLVALSSILVQLNSFVGISQGCIRLLQLDVHTVRVCVCVCVCVCVYVSERGNYLTYCIYYVDISVRVKIMHFKYTVSLQTDKGTIQKALLTRSPHFFLSQLRPTLKNLTRTTFAQLAHRGCKLADWGCKIADWGCKLADRGCKLADRGCKLADRGCKLADWGCKLADWGCKLADWPVKLDGQG